ncbi:hypothetical protein MKS88_003155 [Plasmodium brasilianum]|uniref:Uncharacterized protein n=1 Tax=Plasmodium brasilianum TaxID=5824 RepID=A0ACB9Y8J9_PLABR|nr:hypothetical protein MKS88_003155 [Plasmodium brasilianum]
MDDTPHIIVLSYDEKKFKDFLSFLETKFEFLEKYAHSETYRVRFDSEKKNVKDVNINCFIFKKEAKVKIVNKYYSADVIISCCIIRIGDQKDEENISGKENKENEKECSGDNENEKECSGDNENEKECSGDDENEKECSGDDENEKECSGDDENEKEKINEVKSLKEINANEIPCESVIFLFDDFCIKEKTVVKENPFRNYDEDCTEYIKDTLNGKMIRNENFDLSNLYKGIGIKIAVFPLSFQKENKEYLNFFSDYFIECLYINYERDFLYKYPEQVITSTNSGGQKLKKEEKNFSKLEDFFEEGDERLVEALHCHMWKGLQIKKDNLIVRSVAIPNEQVVTSAKELRSNEIVRISEKVGNCEDVKCDKNTKLIKKMSVSADNKEELFMQNFNKIVEKIRLAKNENTNCVNDSTRRKKAEDLIIELQQYFCDIDED